MSLRDAPLLYVFFEIAHLEAGRQLFESGLGFPVIEIEPHMPHHRHGVVKYDAGGLILSLNLTDLGRFHGEATDGLVSVVDTAADATLDRAAALVGGRRGSLVDEHGHQFDIDARLLPGMPPKVTALRLIVDDLEAATGFYRDVLALELQDSSARTSRFAAGAVDLVLERKTPASERQTRHDTYLIVFYTPDVEATHRALTERGVSFKREAPGYSEIGGSSRFADPAGNHLCLYEPSQECLTWGSGPKVMEIAQIQGGRNARRLADRVPVPVRD